VLSGRLSAAWLRSRNPARSSSRTPLRSSNTSRKHGSAYEEWASSSLRQCYTPPRRSARPTYETDSFSSLPTPTASLYGSNCGGAAGRTGPPRPSLAGCFNLLPTPTAGDAKASGAAGYSTASGRHSGTTLTDVASGAASAGRRGRLNPLLCEWMMGLPIGWTDCEPLEMLSLPRWLRAHSTLSLRIG
jgi:hypothetical protein